jgi:hypothetical protein
VIILGIVLLVVGFLLAIPILWTLGIILVVVGVILVLPGMPSAADGTTTDAPRCAVAWSELGRDQAVGYLLISSGGSAVSDLLRLRHDQCVSLAPRQSAPVGSCRCPWMLTIWKVS